MAAKGVPIELVIGDAMALPFQADSFDVVLNYGALNGISDPAVALAEMARVLRPGGVMLVLDEQMYEAASRVERAYFHRVLSSHNVIHHCPVEALPPGLERVELHQIYQFYYILTARKPESREPGQAAGTRVAAGENGVQ
jgi:ubiquinone/menaquinone biosynthesis C-methylase UbiE